MPILSWRGRSDRLLRSFIFGFVALISGALATTAYACPNVGMTGQQISWSSDQLWQPRTHSVTAGGSNNLTGCSQPGVGWVATSPDFDFNFTNNSAGRTLELRANGSCDVVLLVNDARGQWHFNDDGGSGSNSLISIANAPTGIYDIWVGTYGSSLCGATLALETFGTPPGGGGGGGVVPPPPPPPTLATCPNPSMNGQMLTYNGQGLWTPQRFGVTAGGNVNLGNCPTVPGSGHIIQAADFTLNLTGNNQNYDLEFRTEGGGCDTILLVNDANGQWHYNDDDAGLTSRLRLSAARPGQYDIWVGTFGSTTCQSTLVLETFGGQVAPPPPPPPPPTLAQCPSYANPGQMLAYSGQQLWTPQRHSVVAGGNVNLGACPTVPGTGWVIQNPDYTMNFTNNAQNYDLEFRTEGQGCDTVLLVNDANGQWHFNDDDGGLQSRLRLPRAAVGQYDIWVGTFGQQTCQTTMIAETFGGQVAPPPPTPAVCPNYNTPGQLLAYSGQQLWTPQRHSVVAGGSVDLGACGSVPGIGWVIQNPDYTMNFTNNAQNYDLEFRTEGQGCDTVLLVNDANGQWHFNDDDGGLQSRLRLPTAAVGQYDIWVGTYGQQTCQTTLIAETFGGQVQQPQVLPDPGNLTGFRGQVGQTLLFQITGSTAGSTWGTDIYTDDSTLARAAVHAGAVQVGQTSIVQVTILPGQSSYAGTSRNGVQSANFGAWTGSYQFVGVTPPAPVTPAAHGNWRMNANGWAGTLSLSWNGSAWQGSITWDATNTTEALSDIRFDPATNAVSFTRQVPAATQSYQGFVNGNALNGQFSMMGGAASFVWSATR